jgi:predicted acylesterase/phospholipase RssA
MVVSSKRGMLMINWDDLVKEHPRYEQLAQKYREPRPRKLLALDGGGIRGVLTLEVLSALEDKLKAATRSDDSFRLGDYFDYIAGTSTGAIIAAGLSLGLTAKEMLEFYVDSGKAMFKKPFFLKRLWYKYVSAPLAGELQKKFGKDTALGSEKLRCLLLVVMRNVTTDSFWPVSSNPLAKYNLGGEGEHKRSFEQSNLSIPLWQLVRASTAAPVFFAPEVVDVGESGGEKERFVFEDGGVTPYNNPAFLLFRMATVNSYNLNWETGEENLLLISVGTGAAPKIDNKISGTGKFLLKNAAIIPSAMMYGALVDQDINCRVMGLCVHGAPIDSELGDLIPPVPISEDEGPTFPKPPDGSKRKFIYARYNAELTKKWLVKNGFPNLDPETVGKLDSIDSIDDLRSIGRKVAEEIDVSKFGTFLQ